MREVCEGELDRHLRAMSAEEADLIKTALEKVTGSTCDASLQVTAGSSA